MALNLPANLRNLYIPSPSFQCMKWPLLLVLFTIPIFNIFSAAALEQNLYFHDSLDIEVSINSQFDLVAEGSNPTLQSVDAELLLFPPTDFRQELLNLKTDGQAQQDKVVFRWTDRQVEPKQFGYKALIHTQNERLPVRNKISFPLRNEDVHGYEQYLKPTKTIDSNDPAIIAQASELAEGETDLFKVAFKVANWVDENVNYDLTTLTAETSQKASWVLENKRGVCDEMTSLFVAMMRSLGVPARFVSGISYTTSDLFSAPWQPHGWAEVYFPGVGWVAFDITFGQYGYVDVTHIKLRDGFDPQEPATRYEWLATDVDLQTKKLDVNAAVKAEGKMQAEEIQLEQEIVAREVGLGSYNLIKGILKNKADYYAASTLKIAVPQELEIVGKNRRTILLGPKEVKETYWIVRIPGTLESEFIYTFPALIYSEKNVSVQDEFTVQSGKQYYSKEDIQNLVVSDEEKTYSRKVSFDCNYPRELKQNQEAVISCTVKNSGNTNLYQLNFCLEGVCDVMDLPINQEKSTVVKIKAEQVGWQKIVVSAENNLVEKKAVLEYLVRDDPAIAVTIEHPPSVQLGAVVPLTIQLKKSSFSEPLSVTVVVEGLSLRHKIELERLEKDQAFPVELEGKRLAGKNSIAITTTWKDQDGKLYSDQQTVIVLGEAASWEGKVRLFLNGILKLFYG